MNYQLNILYDGKVCIVENNGDIIPLKYVGYDKVKNTIKIYQYKNKVYSIDTNYDKRVFTEATRESKRIKKGNSYDRYYDD